MLRNIRTFTLNLKYLILPYSWILYMSHFTRHYWYWTTYLIFVFASTNIEDGNMARWKYSRATPTQTNTIHLFRVISETSDACTSTICDLMSICLGMKLLQPQVSIIFYDHDLLLMLSTFSLICTYTTLHIGTTHYVV